MNEPVPVPEVEATEAARLAETGDVLLLDVREDDEWASGHAPQAGHTVLGRRNLTGGMQAWAAAGLPVVGVDGGPGEII